MTKYLKLPNGKKELYSCAITNACILRFLNTNVESVKNFIGAEIIDYINIVDENDKVLESHDIYMKRKTIMSETTTITEYEDRIVKEAYTEEIEVVDPITQETILQTVEHEAVIEKIEKKIPVEMTVAILEKPSIQEEVDSIKTTVGIKNPNNMNLEEFKNYYKEEIGKQCTKAIEDGVDVDTVDYGKKHFSYTIEDQSNIKDLIITAILTNFSLPLPYHADGELCNTYPAKDILKIYMSLSSNKTYHTTYCNVLNEMIMNAKDIMAVKSITYGMKINETKYKEVMKKVNDSKYALLALVEKNIVSLNKG